MFLLAFEFKLLELLGVLPDFASCAECEATSAGGYYHPEDGQSTCPSHARSSPHRIRFDEVMVNVVTQLGATPLRELTGAVVDADVRKRLGKILHWTYTFHINGYSLPEALKLIPKGN